jgi:hypothetical protein
VRVIDEAIDDGNVEQDKFVDKVGTQFVSTDYRGKAVSEHRKDKIRPAANGYVGLRKIFSTIQFAESLPIHLRA